MIYVNIDPIAFSIGNIDVGWYGIMVALAVVTLVTWLLLWVKKDPRISYDMAISAALVGFPSGVILAQAFGRVGCTILGDDYGFSTDLPWGFVYTSPNSPANQAVGLTPTHPVVLYEIIYALILFGILMLLWKKLKPDGSLFLVYLSFYSIWRIGSDFLREGTDFLFGLHQAQVIGIIVLVICIVLIAWKTRWVKKGEAEISDGKSAD